MDHPPDLLLTRAVADQHGEQFPGVESVGLRASPTTFDLDTRRIDHNVVDPMCHEAAMQPEPVPSSLITAIDAGVIGQPKAFLRPGDLAPESPEIARPHGTQARSTGEPRAEAQLPLGPTQLKCQVDDGLRGGVCKVCIAVIMKLLSKRFLIS
jgi:hypothetical protein